MPYLRRTPASGLRAAVLTLLAAFVAAGAVQAEDTASAVAPATRGGGAPRQAVDDATLEKLLKLHHVEEAKVRLVLIPASVQDRRGNLVRGLRKRDFSLYEDHVPQQIDYFSVEYEDPISIAFLLDVSGSMRQVGKLEAAKEAIRHFVEALRPEDQFALIAFADEQVAWITEFTSDRRRFLERLDVQEGFGQTALNDAVAATPRLVHDAIRGKRAIVLITDGVDNASRLSTSQAAALAKRVNVPIYTLGFSGLPEVVTRRRPDLNLQVLRRISDETGGELFTVRDPDDLKEAVSRIEEILRYQYLIGYHPTRLLWDGSYRRIRVETTRNRVVVNARSGYYASP
jgi:Ca-activated chloride channel homolog